VTSPTGTQAVDRAARLLTEVVPLRQTRRLSKTAEPHRRLPCCQQTRAGRCRGTPSRWRPSRWTCVPQPASPVTAADGLED
jgi:hypothetical protein